MLFYHNLIACFTTFTIIFLSNLEVLVLLKNLIFMNVNIISFCHILSKERQTKNPFCTFFCLPRCIHYSYYSQLAIVLSPHPPQKQQTTTAHSDATMPMGRHLSSQNLFASPQTPSYSLYLWCTGIIAVNPQPPPMRILPKYTYSFQLLMTWNCKTGQWPLIHPSIHSNCHQRPAWIRCSS